MFFKTFIIISRLCGFVNRFVWNVYYFKLFRKLCQHFFCYHQIKKFNGAGSGNRTHLSSLEGWSITDIRYPQVVGVTGIEPATSSSQTTRAPSCATPRYSKLVSCLPLFSQRQWLFYNIKSISSIPFLIFSKEIFKKVHESNLTIHQKPLYKPLPLISTY